MSTLFIANLLFMLLSGMIMIAGMYGFMGLCCKGNKVSRVFGAFLGVVGLGAFVVTIIPSCY